VVIQYKATIYHNVDISTLTNELKAVSTASGQGWLLASVSGAAPTIEGSINGVVGQSYDVPIDVNMGFNQNQYGSVTIYGASAPGNGGSSATISVSLQHAKSLSQPLQSEGYPTFDPSVSYADTISLSSDGKTTLSSILQTLGLPEKGLQLSSTHTTSGAATVDTDPASIVGAACTTIRAAFRNPQYVVLSSYDSERILYDYMVSANLTDAEKSANCIQVNNWASYGFSLKPFLPSGSSVVSISQAQMTSKFLSGGLSMQAAESARLASATQSHLAIAPAALLRTSAISLLDRQEQNKNKNKTSTTQEAKMVVRLARETLALASVAGFVWMVCSVAHLVA
jgi:hypothetical protein